MKANLSSRSLGQTASTTFSCHSDRSEESLIRAGANGTQNSQRSFAPFRMTGKEGTAPHDFA
jgi:hypothetical protein